MDTLTAATATSVVPRTISLEIVSHHPNTCSVRNLGKPAEHRLGSKLCRPPQSETRMQNQSLHLATSKPSEFSLLGKRIAQLTAARSARHVQNLDKLCEVKRKAAVKRPWKYNKGGPSKQHPAN
ncbi:hypothetical protein K0M31_001935 [Melipona bicolor]|uniref:Uncharacterized protein n=1 Tax=Melipona bicolor TaxID=60889 RepID=A0AA40GHM8_9HYME|nr:hypothetical protein K0M31_001935 [Melipona bicolor]